MAEIESRTISLPSEQAGYVDAQVERGLYAAQSDIVRAGLLALQEQEAEAVWAPVAQTDLLEIYDDVAPRGGSERALAYVERIQAACMRSG